MKERAARSWLKVCCLMEEEERMVMRVTRLEMRPNTPRQENSTPSHQNSKSFQVCDKMCKLPSNSLPMKLYLKIRQILDYIRVWFAHKKCNLQISFITLKYSKVRFPQWFLSMPVSITDSEADVVVVKCIPDAMIVSVKLPCTDCVWLQGLSSNGVAETGGAEQSRGSLEKI